MMKTKLLTLCVIILMTQNIFAQKKLQVIKATSLEVNIKEDNVLSKNTWTILPAENPDIYITSAKTVTFYTDIDSISIVIEPEKVFDFIIILNEKDSAYTQIKYKEPYLTTLKKASEYDVNQMRKLPKFTYLDSSDVHLKQIKKDFNLDSIAGKGNEISKLLNVMNWVHNIVRHNGNGDNPALKNAIDLVNVCKTENRGVNCRMMAIILNECYLSMGYKSRMITCKPKPMVFQDCHVINSVFSEQLNKWIWLDPTFSAYVMNEKGQLLGLQEVRERLINDQPLILNPEANWNRQQSQTKEHYLNNYMAKNLYRLEIPVHSTYNNESQEDEKTLEYIELLPLDGINQEPQIRDYKNEKSKMTYKTYITNNPNQFWEMK